MLRPQGRDHAFQAREEPLLGRPAGEVVLLAAGSACAPEEAEKSMGQLAALAAHLRAM
jgi:hypothetical protein